MRLEIHKGIKGFNKIKSEWEQLFNKIAVPLHSQSIIWHQAYLNNLVDDVSKCNYFCIYKGDNLIAIFPLENVRINFYLLSFNALCFPEHSHFGLNSIIIDDYEKTNYVFEFLYEALKKDKSIIWDVIYLKRILDNTQAAHCIIQKSKLTVISRSWECNVMPLQDYELTSKKLSKSFKKNLRNRRNRLQKMKNVEFRSSRTTSELKNYFEDFLEVEASGWKGSEGEGTAIKLNKSLKAFYYELLIEFSKQKQIEINLLIVDGISIAAQFVIILEPSLFRLKLGYNENFRGVSPGHLLHEFRLKEYGNNANLKRLNMMSNAKWHADWSPEVILTTNIYNCKNIRTSTYIRFVSRGMQLVKKLKNRFENG